MNMDDEVDSHKKQTEESQAGTAPLSDIGERTKTEQEGGSDKKELNKAGTVVEKETTFGKSQSNLGNEVE